MSVFREWLTGRVMPPPEPPLTDLLAESKARTAEALGDAVEASRREAKRLAAGSVTWSWPDPYGPDPVVFGSVPRAGE